MIDPAPSLFPSVCSAPLLAEHGLIWQVAWLYFEDTDAHNFVMLQHLHWKADRLR